MLVKRGGGGRIHSFVEPNRGETKGFAIDAC